MQIVTKRGEDGKRPLKTSEKYKQCLQGWKQLLIYFVCQNMNFA